MNRSELERIAHDMVAKGKGILAADESSGTISKRFGALKIESTEEHRRRYREMLFTAPGMAESISGVILYDETIRQKTSDGTPFPRYLEKLGIIPGIKVDTGAKPVAGFPGETITEGHDGLRERLIDIGAGIPTNYAIAANAEALARYAALCQENGIVPIVEPEVLMDGDHSIEHCEGVTEVVLARVFDALIAARVHLEGIILKPNMVISGKKNANRAGPEAVAAATLRTLKRRVPAAVPGIAFLSGGQSSAEATLHLSLMNAAGPLPWPLTFSYGRALQDIALKTWGGEPDNFVTAQKEFAKRARLNGLATSGAYLPAMETQAA
jgi:fructose-bisphosphate aldolase class I